MRKTILKNETPKQSVEMFNLSANQSNIYFTITGEKMSWDHKFFYCVSITPFMHKKAWFDFKYSKKFTLAAIHTFWRIELKTCYDESA